jgi:hypothetical protein
MPIPRAVEEKVFEYLNDYRYERCQKIRDGRKAVFFLHDQRRFVSTFPEPVPIWLTQSLRESFCAASTRLWHFAGPLEAQKYAIRAVLLADVRQRVPLVN